MFWVDEIIEDINKRLNKDAFLITDWKTPSGHIHVGALRGLIVHDLIRRGLSDGEKPASFQWGYDDFDPMDGMPIYIDESFKQYMGKPLCDVPAPDGTSKSFAQQYANEFTEVFKGLGIEPKIVWTSELYKQGKFNDAIRIILDHADEIRGIYKTISGSEKPNDWFPLQVVCPKCGKVGTTKVTSWDGKEVEFTCEENLVEWAQGCGYKGKISPFDGNGKLPWKVEWPSKWFITQTDIEGEGKDHSAASGSRQVADEIYRKVFEKNPPYDIPYEFILIGGAKMSSSKGLGVTAKDISELLPANILRFLFTRTRAKRTIDFNPEGDTIPNLYDEYDRCLSAFFEDKESDLGRAFHYAEIDLEKEQPRYLLRFSKVAYMLQMPRVDIFEYAEKEKGEKLSEAERREIESRVEIAKMWLENYAPESFKFVVQESLPDAAKSLSDQQKEFLTKVLEEIKSKEWTGEDLHKKIHEIKTEMGINPRDAFSAIYLSFIGKESGPQAGWLLASLEKDMVITRLEEASND